MRVIMASRPVLGWLGLLAMVAVAGCTATSMSSPAQLGHSGSASPAATTAFSPGTASGSAPTGPGGVRNLAVSLDVRRELIAAYVEIRGISLSDVAGTIPGTVHYAYDPATDTYWAQAVFEPSSTASLKVSAGFQDGASAGLFTRTVTGSWQAQLGGEPVRCAEMWFFPQAVLAAWSLPTDAARFGCSSPGPTHLVTSPTYAASVSIPRSWLPTPYLGNFGYDGTSGWMELNAATEPSGLRHACTDAATGNVLHPYGLHPQIIYRNIDGRPGCLIFPSGDAPALGRSPGGPAFQASSALVEYRQPIGTYALLVVDADPGHLVAIVDSVQLFH